MAPSPTDSIDEPTRSGNVRWSIGFWAGLAIVFGLVVAGQFAVWQAALATPEPDWWSSRSPDWLPFLPLILLAVPLWFVRRSLLPGRPRWWTRLRGWGGESCPTSDRSVTRREELRAFALSLLVGGVGFVMSWHVSRQFGELPPAYHDEFSYLLQAKTFLAGRTSFPSHPQMPELFDQVHVLNEGRFASRYFPGVGLWMAPFVALGNPWWGHRVAHAFASFLLFWIGRHLSNNAVGLLAGGLLAVSPGVALFSNLLLSHHPTLVGLLVFVITFLKLTRAIEEGTTLWHWAVLSGSGLTYAMLCRPMTAAGVGLPFGLWFGWWVLTGKSGGAEHQPETSPSLGFVGKLRLLLGGRVSSEADGPAEATSGPSLRSSPGHPNVFRQSLGDRIKTALAMGVPILLGLAGLFFYNRAITGDGFVTPYQQYTDIYTPRHVYGFNNVVRGEQRLGPKVLEQYDQWAENLTPSLARRNVGRRITSSLRWTLGIVPLTLIAIVYLVTIDLWNRDWWLVSTVIVSLHAVHIPYWFEGIMGWHYVFESAPFWLLLFAGVSRQLWRYWGTIRRPGMLLWWTGLIAVSVAVNLVTMRPIWPARLDVGVAEVSFSRQRHAAFSQQMERLTGGRRALVLIDPDPADRHIDYVVNDPQLDARILYGRYRPGTTDRDRVVATFSDRDVYLVHLMSGQVERLSQSRSADD